MCLISIKMEKVLVVCLISLLVSIKSEIIPYESLGTKDNSFQYLGGNTLTGGSFKESFQQIPGKEFQHLATAVDTLSQNIPVQVPQPYPVVVNRPVQVPVPHPYPVVVNRPVQVSVPQPYPVEVPRPVPVPVTRTVTIPVPQPYKVPVQVPVQVPVPQPYPVSVPQPYPVRVPQYIPFPQPVNIGGGITGQYGGFEGFNKGFEGGYLGESNKGKGSYSYTTVQVNKSKRNAKNAKH